VEGPEESLGVGGVGGRFEHNVAWRLGHGKRIKFWEDKWINSEALNVRFSRLYSITKDKSVVVSQVGVWVNNKWSWKAKWRRALFVWEMDEESRLLSLLEDKVLSIGSMDHWVWKSDEDFCYTVSSAYRCLRMFDDGTYGPFMRCFGALRRYHHQ